MTYSLNDKKNNLKQKENNLKSRYQVTTRISTNNYKEKNKDVLFITGYWNAKAGNQVISGVECKFGLEYKVKQGTG